MMEYGITSREKNFIVGNQVCKPGFSYAQNIERFAIYRRPLFNCEILIIANCEVSHNSQLLETQ